MDSDYIPFGDVSRGQLGMQCQYGSRYVTTHGADLRFKYTDTSCYHDILIHKDDVEEFVKRVLASRMVEE